MIDIEQDDENKSAAPSLSGVVEAILEVGRQRAALLTAMKRALKSGDHEQVLALCRKLCGITNGEESNRADPSINRGAGGR